MTSRLRCILLRFIAAPSLALWGCAGGPADVAGEKATAAETTDQINGQLLQSVDLGDGQKIDFYEFADQEIGGERNAAGGHRESVAILQVTAAHPHTQRDLPAGQTAGEGRAGRPR